MLGDSSPKTDINASRSSDLDREASLQPRHSIAEITGFDKDYVPVPWKAVPQILRHIANEVRTLETAGGKFSVGFEQPRRFGGASGRIDRFFVTSNDIDTAAYCVEYIQEILEEQVRKRDGGEQYHIYGIDDPPDVLKDAQKGCGWIRLAEMDRLVYEPPIFMERQVTDHGEEFVINSELLEKETNRWMAAFRTSNHFENRHRNLHTLPKPFCDAPGQVFLYISTLAKEVKVSGEIEWIPLEIPSVLINRGRQSDISSTLRNYHEVPYKYGSA